MWYITAEIWSAKMDSLDWTVFSIRRVSNLGVLEKCLAFKFQQQCLTYLKYRILHRTLSLYYTQATGHVQVIWECRNEWELWMVIFHPVNECNSLLNHAIVVKTEQDVKVILFPTFECLWKIKERPNDKTADQYIYASESRNYFSRIFTPCSLSWVMIVFHQKQKQAYLLYGQRNGWTEMWWHRCRWDTKLMLVSILPHSNLRMKNRGTVTVAIKRDLKQSISKCYKHAYMNPGPPKKNIAARRA